MTFIAVISIVFISAVYTLDSLTLSSYQPFLLGTVDENNIYISNTNVDMIFNVITKEKTFLSSHLSYLNYNNFPWVIIRNSIKYIFDNNKYIILTMRIMFKAQLHLRIVESLFLLRQLQFIY